MFLVAGLFDFVELFVRRGDHFLGGHAAAVAGHADAQRQRIAALLVFVQDVADACAKLLCVLLRAFEHDDEFVAAVAGDEGALFEGGAGAF